jgi:hypothetical protein
MHYSGYVGPRDGAMSVLISSQQEAVMCMQHTQKEGHCFEGWLSARDGMSKFEQWENVKICQKLGRSASKTFQMI